MSDNKNTDWDNIQNIFDADNTGDGPELSGMLKQFHQDLESHPYLRQESKNDAASRPTASDMSILMRRLILPATTGLAAVLIVTFVFFSSPTLSWAQVVRQFQEIEFLSASVYIKDDGLSTPEHIELWMGKGCKVRVRIGNQLIFAQKAEVLAAFDLKTKKQTEPDEMGAAMIRLLGADETFSMNTVLRGLSGGRITDKTPVLNSNAIIAEDLAVFDLETGQDNNPQWFRIWALKKSGLPVRIRMWDPRDAATVEMLIDYSKPQPEPFFDPKAFASALADVRTNELNLAYLYLKDPGGKSYVPGITDENKAMSIVTKTIDGEDFSLAHYCDRNILIFVWDRYHSQLDLQWLRKMAEQYATNENLKIVTIALEKNPENVRRMIESQKIPFVVLHEQGKGFNHPIARALGVKDASEFWLLHNGKAHKTNRYSEGMVDLACKGLRYENEMHLTRFLKLNETTKEQMLDLCGKPHKTELSVDTELWSYMFTSPDGGSKRTVTIRFNTDGKYSGRASAGGLVNPSVMAIEISKEFWRKTVGTAFGEQNLPKNNPDHHIEIALDGGDSRYIIGGGHPRTEILPDTEYSRQLPAGEYTPTFLLMNHNNTYTQIKKAEICGEITVGKNEKVQVYLDATGQPKTTRSAYKAGPIDNTEKTRQGLLAKPDYKKMLRDAANDFNNHDDPKYLPWQLHLKEIARRYDNKPLPEKIDLFAKGTDEKYALTMFPRNLPGHDGWSARSIEGDLKDQFRSHPLGPGLMRWPEDVPTVKMNHDLVYNDDVSRDEQCRFILARMGYRLEKQTENRKVIVAEYNGRPLPDPNTLSAPDRVGVGWFSARNLIDYMTRAMDRDLTATSPLFVDETNLPSKTDSLQGYKDSAITVELPRVANMEHFEKVRPWFKENFGITFMEETRAIEMFIITKSK